MWDEPQSAIVIDNGGHQIKAGFAGDDKPRSFLRPYFGRPRFQGPTTKKECYVGDEAWRIRGLLKDKMNPINCGLITNYEIMEKIWSHTFNEVLHIEDPLENFVYVLTPQGDRCCLIATQEKDPQKIYEILFETIGVGAAAIENPQVLALGCCGGTTGVSLNIGEDQTIATSIKDGKVVQEITTDIGGRALTDYLMFQLGKDDSLQLDNTLAERVECEELKELRCCVRPLEGHYQSNNSTYEWPDGQIVTLSEQAQHVPEALFNPKLLGRPESSSVQDLVISAFNEPSIIRDPNFAISGGSASFPGLLDRLKQEISVQRKPTQARVRYLSTDTPLLWRTFVGGSVFASVGGFQDRWMQRMDWDERGPRSSRAGRKQF